MFNTDYYKRLHSLLTHEYNHLTMLVDDAGGILEPEINDNLTMLVIAHDALSAYLSALEVLMEVADGDT